MNDKPNTLFPEEEKDEVRPLRRARRTPSPFADSPASEENVTPPADLPSAEVAIAPAPEEPEVTEPEAVEESAEPEAVEEPAEPEAAEEPAEPEAVEEPAEPEAIEEPAEPEAADFARAWETKDLPKETAAKEKKGDAPLSPAGNAFDWIKTFLFSLAAVIFVFTLLFRGVTVNGGSMLPTLENKEYLIISDLFYSPKTGDIVVLQSPTYKDGQEPLIKRVIATGGQTVTINFITWEVWVDDVLLREDYILHDGANLMNCEDMVPDENGIASVTVEENCIFVMGDHRNDSLDSRSMTVGQIDERYIMGRVVLRITPFDRFGPIR